MAKVKMSDIKSGSENVKEVFRATMSGSRRKKFVNQTFTNSELIEILDISENVENHNEKRNMYQRLILSQSGPFDIHVYREFIDKLFDRDALIHLLKNSVGIGIPEKKRFIDYAMVTSSNWFTTNFFNTNESKKYGIDILTKPFNVTLASDSVRYLDKRYNVAVRTIPSDFHDFFGKIMDSMSDADKHTVYLEGMSTTYADRVIQIIMNYNNMDSKSIEHYFKKSDRTNKEKLATHPNCPVEIREIMYKETGDEKFLSQEVQDLFLF